MFNPLLSCLHSLTCEEFTNNPLHYYYQCVKYGQGTVSQHVNSLKCNLLYVIAQAENNTILQYLVCAVFKLFFPIYNGTKLCLITYELDNNNNFESWLFSIVASRQKWLISTVGKHIEMIRIEHFKT